MKLHYVYMKEKWGLDQRRYAMFSPFIRACGLKKMTRNMAKTEWYLLKLLLWGTVQHILNDIGCGW